MNPYKLCYCNLHGHINFHYTISSIVSFSFFDRTIVTITPHSTTLAQYCNRSCARRSRYIICSMHIMSLKQMFAVFVHPGGHLSCLVSFCCLPSASHPSTLPQETHKLCPLDWFNLIASYWTCPSFDYILYYIGKGPPKILPLL